MSTLLCLRKKDGRRTDPLDNLVTTDDPILHFVRAVLYNAMGFQAESDSESSDWFCFCLYIFVTRISRLVWEKKWFSITWRSATVSQRRERFSFLPSRTAFKLTQEWDGSIVSYKLALIWGYWNWRKKKGKRKPLALYIKARSPNLTMKLFLALILIRCTPWLRQRVEIRSSKACLKAFENLIKICPQSCHFTILAYWAVFLLLGSQRPTMDPRFGIRCRTGKLGSKM